MDILSETECYELLNQGQVGRVGVVVEGKQMILPVNYATDGQSVVFKVGGLSVLAINAPMAQVAFEIDSIDEVHREGWSVLFQGVAHDVTDTIDANSENLRKLDLTPWAPGEKSVWLKVTPREISGRRIP